MILFILKTWLKYMEENNKTLTNCIPTYYRRKYLDKQLQFLPYN